MSGSVPASGALPRGWWNDPVIRDDVREQIRALLARGYLTDQEVARRVGVSGRTMVRLRARLRA